MSVILVHEKDSVPDRFVSLGRKRMDGLYYRWNSWLSSELHISTAKGFVATDRERSDRSCASYLQRHRTEMLDVTDGKSDTLWDTHYRDGLRYETIFIETSDDLHQFIFQYSGSQQSGERQKNPGYRSPTLMTAKVMVVARVREMFLRPRVVG